MVHSARTAKPTFLERSLGQSCCAADVIASASSRIISLCRPGGRVTFFCANILILVLTTSMPLESDALSSSTASLYVPPRSWRARQRTDDVLPDPGGPARIMLGRLPEDAIARSRFTASSFPTTLVASPSSGATGSRGSCRAC